MNDIHSIPTAAQPQPSTTKAVTAFNSAIGNALFALKNGPIDCAIINLEKASRLAVEVRNPHAHELANLAVALATSSETAQLVEMCLLDLFPDQ